MVSVKDQKIGLRISQELGGVQEEIKILREALIALNNKVEGKQTQNDIRKIKTFTDIDIYVEERKRSLRRTIE